VVWGVGEGVKMGAEVELQPGTYPRLLEEEGKEAS